MPSIYMNEFENKLLQLLESIDESLKLIASRHVREKYSDREGGD